jgi:putative aldouronate transport system permease protein
LAEAKKKNIFTRLRNDLRRNHDLYWFALPAFLVVLIFNYFPMYGVQIAFRNYQPATGILNSPWKGLIHFQRFFASYASKTVIKNTVILSLMSIVMNFPFPILLALVFSQLRNARLKKTVQTIAYMPHFISTVVMVGMIVLFLSPNNGVFGVIMRALGMEPKNLMGMPEAFRWVYVFTDMWQHSGWDSIIYLAALSAVDVQLYDAAEVDGANRWRKVWHIDIPSIIPTITILLILRMGNVMSVGFEKAFLMQNTMNVGTSDVISTYVYRIGMRDLQYSYSAAIGLFNSVINFVFLIAVNFISRRISDFALW